jgi:hypothetical protein
MTARTAQGSNLRPLNRDAILLGWPAVPRADDFCFGLIAMRLSRDAKQINSDDHSYAVAHSSKNKLLMRRIISHARRLD